MTVKEFYEICKDNGLENAPMLIEESRYDEKFHDMVYFQFESFKVDFYKADPNDPDPDEEKVVLYV